MLGSAAVTAGAQEGTWSSLAAVLDAKWWADASVNDGLFVRRDADDETFTGFAMRRQGGEGCQRDPRFLFFRDYEVMEMSGDVRCRTNQVRKDF